MSPSILPHRQCHSSLPVIVRPRRRLVGRRETGPINAANKLTVPSHIALESLGATPVLLTSLSQPHDTEPICTAAMLKSP
jgi:hypothetical protein